MKKPRIIFMGTPDFAVTIVDTLRMHGADIVAIITAPDKQSGRGRKLNQSAVKKYADQHYIPTLQPTNLKSEDFLKELQGYNADLQIVVAFRMLPEVVWQMPPMGTINLHASLLPQYRGAAPINWAIINGEKQTGVTTFFLQHKIDTGDIIMQQSAEIGEEMTAGELHDELASLGAKLVVETYECIASGTVNSAPQNSLVTTALKEAPKIYKENCRISWGKDGIEIYNLIRGLCPRPGAWTEFLDENNRSRTVKIFVSTLFQQDHTAEPGSLRIQDGTLSIYCKDGYLVINELQMEGKRRMNADDFLRGSNLNNKWKAL